jgi:hypothetical protein
MKDDPDVPDQKELKFTLRNKKTGALRDMEIIPMKESTKMPDSHCTRCLKKLDAASSEEKERPAAGDLSICLYCGHLMLFDQEMKLRDLTPEEMRDVRRSDTWSYIQSMQKKFRAAEVAGAVDKETLLDLFKDK